MVLGWLIYQRDVSLYCSHSWKAYKDIFKSLHHFEPTKLIGETLGFDFYNI